MARICIWILMYINKHFRLNDPVRPFPVVYSDDSLNYHQKFTHHSSTLKQLSTMCTWRAYTILHLFLSWTRACLVHTPIVSLYFHAFRTETYMSVLVKLQTDMRTATVVHSTQVTQHWKRTQFRKQNWCIHLISAIGN